jgi:Glucosamine-6-phosphate isomerases/6-phosphogluconolactonase
MGVSSRYIAPVLDSPKPPPERITMTLAVLNNRTRFVVFCGTGSSKGPIVQKVFGRVTPQARELTQHSEGSSSIVSYSATLADPPPFPCAMVRPAGETTTEDPNLTRLTWILDQEAMVGVTIEE